MTISKSGDVRLRVCVKTVSTRSCSCMLFILSKLKLTDNTASARWRSARSCSESTTHLWPGEWQAAEDWQWEHGNCWAPRTASTVVFAAERLLQPRWWPAIASTTNCCAVYRSNMRSSASSSAKMCLVTFANRTRRRQLSWPPSRRCSSSPGADGYPGRRFPRSWWTNKGWKTARVQRTICLRMQMTTMNKVQENTFEHVFQMTNIKYIWKSISNECSRNKYSKLI